MSYTLHYFNFSGRGEPLRLALAICGVPFVDKRISGKELMAGKASGFLPYGVVPVLEVEKGSSKSVIAESSGIMAYIVATHGAAGGMARTDPLDIARVEEIRSATDAMLNSLGPSLAEKDEARKLAMRAELAANALPKSLAAIDARLQPSGYASGASLTAADLTLDSAVGWLAAGALDGIPKTIADPYANIARCRENVRAHPSVQAWYKSQQS
ncbi:hypothetical protein JKP88DRAFT_166894 [Tribonema minus]|uniref:Glutathione S-transferase n=1 Tax=Tribonema minus TaxID=303371 RepID=A0A835YS97_9STRA|nr:hypothetical protein JKP88DRAFT_166894 [Tribonema minus]